MMTEASAVDAGALAQAIRDVGQRARTEEDVRVGVEKLLEPALRQLGVVAQPRYESRIRRTVLTAPGRADALYGQAVIEYEPPGKLSTARGLASTRKQLEGYLLGLAGSGSQREAALRRVAGIGLDGQSIFFLRYRGDRPSTEEERPKGPLTQLPLLVEEPPKGSFSLVGPFSITEESVNEFLLHLRALRRRPLEADELAKEFGPAGGVAHEMVNTLYSRLEECLTAPGNPFPRVETLYEEWKRIFGIVYGQELVKAQRDAQALARLYHVTEFSDLKPLLFAVHTYYALLMKLLAAELLSLQQGALLASVAEQLPALGGDVLRSRLGELEKGAWFEAQGIRNFLEGDFFGWYLAAWNADIETAVRNLARALAEYEPATGTLAPEATRDLLKKLYQYLVPRELRHDLGEYYTPDWLAELVLNEVGYSGNPDERLLDPGFRRFRLGQEGAHLKVLSAHDLVELQPFEGASNRTAVVVLEKGARTEYPTRYTLWRKAEAGRVGVDLPLAGVEQRTTRTELSARPVNATEPTSPWLTASPAALAALQKVVGPSAYQAHEGANTGGANGVYWLRVLERQPDGLLLVENLHDVGKIKVKKVQALIEPDFVYPLLRGRDVSRWRPQPSAYILMVQDPAKRTGYDESWLKVNYPHTYAYLKQFEDVLRQRSGYKKYFDPAKDPFYSMYDVGQYTLAPYKVVWRGEVAPTLIAAVSCASDGRTVVPDQTVYFASSEIEGEAHFVCALLGSAPVRALYWAHRYKHVSMDFVRNLAIGAFDVADPIHQTLASLSQRAHQLAALGKEGETELRQVEGQIDRAAAQLWGITEEELGEIGRALAELA